MCLYEQDRAGEGKSGEILMPLTDGVWEGNILTISIKCKERRGEGRQDKILVFLVKVEAGWSSELFLQKITHLCSCIYLLLTLRKFIDPRISIEKISNKKKRFPQ